MSEKDKFVSTESIAEKLNISRATVSRALNGKSVSEKTRTAVIEAAINLGYKSYGIASNQATHKTNKVLVLSTHLLMSASFFSSVMRGIESVLVPTNTELIQYTYKHPFNRDDKKDLERFIKSLKIDGAICFGCYEKSTIDYTLEFNIPTVFFDFNYRSFDTPAPCDIILSESLGAVENVCTQLIKTHGVRSLGFIGDWHHCRGFYERFLGMREACFFNDLPLNEKHSVTESNKTFYYDSRSLYKVIKNFDTLPDCFVCANDYIAHSLLSVLNKMQINIPNDIKVIGFDNVIESRHTLPPLSTFDIDKAILGKYALLNLLERIKSPAMETRIIYMKSKYIARETTSI